ncbi:MAG: glycosyltransferase family 1 protein [Gemmatales bacterium]
MRIAIDARPVYQEATLRGVGQSLLGLYRTLAIVRPSWIFDMYFQTSNNTDHFVGQRNVMPRHLDHPGDRINAWQHLWFPLATWISKAELLHAHGAIAPRCTLTPMVTTIHDLTPIDFWPERPDVKAWIRNVASGAHRAKRVLVCSEHTRKEVIRVINVPANKIEVVRWGANEAMHKVTDITVINGTVKRHGLEPGQTFLMHFGMALPRKNTRRLLEAWAALPDTIRNESRLLVIGLDSFGLREFTSLAKSLGIIDTVRFYEYVSQVDIPSLLSAAHGLCYIPLSEGFGLPILDAFACDTPVLASRVTSIPEVAGNGAILVDPTDQSAITDGLRVLLTEASICEELRCLGRERLRHFSWNTCAEQVADIFEKVVNR